MLAPPAIVLLVLASGIAWFTLRELAVPPGAAVAPAPVAAAPAEQATADAAAARAQAPSRLATSALFGIIAEPAAPPATEPEEAPTTAPEERVPDDLPVAALGVTVQGIVFDPGGRASHALLDGAAREPRIYTAGDEVRSGVTIRAVEAERVVIERDGKLEELPLEALDPRGGARLSRAAAAAPPRGERPATPASPPSAAVMRLRDIAARNGVTLD
ncbi:MAG: type II secretion system protein N [Gammaproteobacteria bacterium]